MRAALYLRVSTARQAEHDVSIPDQRRQGEAYCAWHGHRLVDVFVDAGVSAKTGRRPEFQRMIELAAAKPAPFDMIIVHSFSRFFRDHFELEFHIRKLARNGVTLVSITQAIGDDPMHVMMRRVMSLFDEYQSRENAKHVRRAMRENARQGFWNGALPPIGYRIVAAESRGAKIKKKLEIDPLHAGTVRLIYRLALEGDGSTGPLGVKAIATYLNARKLFTRDGGRWGVGAVHQILTRTTYVGRHVFDRHGGGEVPGGSSEGIIVPVPPLVDEATFSAIQAHLRSRNPKITPPRIVNGPTLLTGLLHCARCGGAMILRTGKGRYRYYSCRVKAQQNLGGCSGMAVRMEAFDALIIRHLEARLLDPQRLRQVLTAVLDRRRERTGEHHQSLTELEERVQDVELRLERLQDAIERGVIDPHEPCFREHLSGLHAIRDRARNDVKRAQAVLGHTTPRMVTPAMLRKFVNTVRRRVLSGENPFRRAYGRTLIGRIDVDLGQVLISGKNAV